jgi:preprotein translocase subunit YajC
VTRIFDIAILAQDQPGGGSTKMWVGLLLMIVVFYGMIAWGSHKDKKRRRDMLGAVKKNDRVMTIGGIIGTVVTVSDTEVTLKVDESANVKITVVRSAIQKVLTEGEAPTEVGSRQ